MASEIKSDKLSPSTGTALQIGDASDTITIPTGATFTVTDGIGVASGGTGLASFTAGDILYATGSTTLAKLAKGTAEQVLAMNTGATAPDWGSVDLTVLPTITVAKGGTNLTSFTAGDILYATGATTLTKLAKGTGSQTLKMNSGATAPEWATVAAGGSDLEKLADYTASNDSTVDMNGDFTTDYDNYLYVFEYVQPATSNTTMRLRAMEGGSIVSVGAWRYAGFNMYNDLNNSRSNAAKGNYNDDNFNLNTGEIGTDSTSGVCGYVWIYSPLLTTKKKVCYTSMFCSRTGEDTMNHYWGSGFYGQSAAWSGVSVYMDSGNVSSGKISVYGLKPYS